MLKTGCTALALSVMAFTNPAAAGCATAGDVAALKTAVLQQELMVAAFQCHEAGAYNRFVTDYRGELQSSDAALKSFFVKRGGEHGEAGYDTFKTKAANLSGLEQARDSRAFCADAHVLFAGVARNDGSLAQFVAQRSAPLDVGAVCQDARPVLAMSRPTASQLVRVADARPAQGDVAIGGVPDHALPVRPFKTEAADREAMDDAMPPAAAPQDLPPPRPRIMAVRDREDYGDQNYAPPPRWQRQAWRDYPPPPPPPGWYPRERYYGW